MCRLLQVVVVVGGCVLAAVLVLVVHVRAACGRGRSGWCFFCLRWEQQQPQQHKHQHQVCIVSPFPVRGRGVYPVVVSSLVQLGWSLTDSILPALHAGCLSTRGAPLIHVRTLLPFTLLPFLSSSIPLPTSPSSLRPLCSACVRSTNRARPCTYLFSLVSCCKRLVRTWC